VVRIRSNEKLKRSSKFYVFHFQFSFHFDVQQIFGAETLKALLMKCISDCFCMKSNSIRDVAQFGVNGKVISKQLSHIAIVSLKKKGTGIVPFL